MSCLLFSSLPSLRPSFIFPSGQETGSLPDHLLVALSCQVPFAAGRRGCLGETLLHNASGGLATSRSVWCREREAGKSDLACPLLVCSWIRSQWRDVSRGWGKSLCKEGFSSPRAAMSGPQLLRET